MLEGLGEPDAVTLMYDRRRSIIGVMPSPLHRQHAYALKLKESRNGRKSRGRMVYAKKFCNQPNRNYRLPLTRSKQRRNSCSESEVRSAKRLGWIDRILPPQSRGDISGFFFKISL